VLAPAAEDLNKTNQLNHWSMEPFICRKENLQVPKMCMKCITVKLISLPSLHNAIAIQKITLATLLENNADKDQVNKMQLMH
jgi:hypothetical protein